MSTLMKSLLQFTGGDENARWGAPLIAALVLGLAALGTYAGSQDNSRAAIAAALLAGGASLGIGAALGFLFGIPRVVAEGSREKTMLDGDSSYQVNTNLEQVSDWLTKIIVGVSLVQTREILGYFKTASDNLALALGGPKVPSSLASTVLIYFGINGFLLCYLWTRLLLMQEFSRADLAAKQSPEFSEGIIHAFLYRPPPDGFTFALNGAKEFLKRFGDGNWRVWRSIACANAQKYSYLHETDREAAESARKDALEAVKRVLSICPSERESMMGLWDPARATAQENDLVVFFGMKEFKETFGEKVSEARAG